MQRKSAQPRQTERFILIDHQRKVAKLSADDLYTNARVGRRFCIGYRKVLRMSDQMDGSMVVPSPLPEQIEINGVTYVRQADWVDARVNEINLYQEVAKRTGLSLRQVFWFQRGFGDGSVMPD